MLQEFNQPFLVDIVEEAFDVGFDDVVDRFVFHAVTQGSERIMATSAWTESIGVRYEVLLVYCFQNPNQARLNKFVFKAWYPQGALFGAARLGNYTSAGQVAVCTPSGAAVLSDPPDWRRGSAAYMFLGHFVDAGGCVFPQPLEASPYEFLVHQVIQTGELETWFLTGLLRYAKQFRFHRFSASVNGRCFLTPRYHVWPPSLQRHYPPSPVLRGHPTPCASFAFLPLRLSGILPFREETQGLPGCRVIRLSDMPWSQTPGKRSVLAISGRIRVDFRHLEKCRPSRSRHLRGSFPSTFRLTACLLAVLRLKLYVTIQPPRTRYPVAGQPSGAGFSPARLHDLARPQSRADSSAFPQHGKGDCAEGEQQPLLFIPWYKPPFQ